MFFFFFPNRNQASKSFRMKGVGHAEGGLAASSLYPLKDSLYLKVVASTARFLLGSVWKMEQLTMAGAGWGQNLRLWVCVVPGLWIPDPHHKTSQEWRGKGEMRHLMTRSWLKQEEMGRPTCRMPEMGGVCNPYHLRFGTWGRRPSWLSVTYSIWVF